MGFTDEQRKKIAEAIGAKLNKDLPPMTCPICHTSRWTIGQGVMGGVAGHAGLFSTAADVSRFARCLLDRGAPLFRAETVNLFTTRQSSPARSSRALGWDTRASTSQCGEYFSARTFGHLGYTGTSLWIDPEFDLAVTLLTNRTWPDCRSQVIKKVRPQLHNAIVKAIAGRA